MDGNWRLHLHGIIETSLETTREQYILHHPWTRTLRTDAHSNLAIELLFDAYDPHSLARRHCNLVFKLTSGRFVRLDGNSRNDAM